MLRTLAIIDTNVLSRDILTKFAKIFFSFDKYGEYSRKELYLWAAWKRIVKKSREIDVL